MAEKHIGIDGMRSQTAPIQETSFFLRKRAKTTYGNVESQNFPVEDPRIHSRFKVGEGKGEGAGRGMGREEMEGSKRGKLIDMQRKGEEGRTSEVEDWRGR